MKQKKQKKRQTKDILNAIKAEKRKNEIAQHGKLINYASTVKSKKVYSRKKKHTKAEDFD